MVRQPHRTLLHIPSVFGLGANRRETEEVFQFRHEALAMGLGISEKAGREQAA